MAPEQHPALDSAARASVQLEREQGLGMLPFRYEQLLLDIVFTGSVTNLNKAFSTMQGSAFYLDKLSGSEERQRMVTIIASVALLTRTVIMAGVDERRAYRYGNAYIKRLNELSQAEDFETTMYEILESFTQLVHNERNRGYSPLVRRALQSIDRHLYQRVRLGDIAADAGVTPEYLASVFKREVGMTVMDYVHREKILQAKAHLLDSSLSIGDVADLFGYANQGHFSTTFKRICGITPSAWRRGEHALVEQSMREPGANTSRQDSPM